jgi:hypothetical protein
MVDIAGEPRVRVTVIDNVAARTNIVRRFLATTVIKDPKPFWRSKI